ncbi:ankyrin repeat domain-containing protein [Limnoglobus roseus]|uniref:Ankyrin repeat domain-containing protein n=1 Tax=Limnoglobus roseus TaxID=2598579 RepID=A0A5C1A8L3_9BACT|nr:ankyrin repeat domain-containing protein [Limnoglobus roseus]QEL13428.1 ankyrin repeat domain-containing protein [Limnoglobus roseus]
MHGHRIILAALVVMFCGSFTTAADTPLADAAEKADWPRVRTLLKDKADANATQTDGMTALHWAAYHDDAAVAKLLLDAGAKPKAENRYGVTPLSLACTNGNAEIVTALLKAGADANAAIRGGETALMTAARTGKVGPVKALLDAGAKVDAAEKHGQTAIMWAAAEGHADVIDLLVKAGADAKVRLKSGFTPMLFAAREGRIDAVNALLKAGVDANEAIKTDRKGGGTTPKDGTSALILAVENGHFELALALVKAGADPNDQRSGYTPLHTLSWVRKPNRGDDPDGQPPPTGSGKVTCLEFVKQLAKAGADVNAKLKGGPSGRGKIAMTGTTPFLLAAKTADLPFLKLLVELGADPLLTNKDGTTPLMAAAGYGTLAPDEEAGTEAECLAAVEYLLTLKADVNAVDKNGETTMHGAAYKNLPKMVQLLADKGAKVDVWNKKNAAGWTPLLIAEGFRPGNFKPSPETIDAIHRVMRAAGVTPPPPTPRPGK